MDTFGIANIILLHSFESKHHITYDNAKDRGAFMAYTGTRDIVFKPCPNTGFPYIDLDGRRDAGTNSEEKL